MRSDEAQLRAQIAQGCGCRTNKQLKAENEALRVIVAEIHWMARRYADGRSSYAPGMLNFRTKELLGMVVELRTPHFARDGMGRKYDGLTEEEVKAAEEDMPKAFQQQVKETTERKQKLVDALEEIAEQRKRGEPNGPDEDADYEGAYHAIIDVARRALTSSPPAEPKLEVPYE